MANRKTYILYVYPYGPSAKNKAIVETGAPNMRAPDARFVQRFAFQARDNDEAYRYICESYDVHDPRPIAGKSYVKPRKFAVGDRVQLVKPYPIGYDDAGKPVTTDRAVISERNETLISVDFNGIPGQTYHTRFVDFSISEIV